MIWGYLQLMGVLAADGGYLQLMGGVLAADVGGTCS